MGTSLDIGLQIVKTAGSLALILGVLLVCFYGFRRAGLLTHRAASNAWIQVIAQHPLGMKHSLLLVKVQGQTFFLGTSPQGLHFLAVIAGEAESPAADPP
ncbi:FliO/MopB family protein [Desulfoferrobacter suflitae]|uniref:FliO/MopB family protein n=1 Tax=Desulfoferrobacter suflitae TaxID=2865782 RepID=UPI00216463F4|nr:flagellar biosynthetic protein FliO [Desulfoferrobacter suflitae]MCK8602429.1 flagellar biosynthetic protein FliO [Desulfoferrobacter suflitae]